MSEQPMSADPMSVQEWRGIVNQLIYALEYNRVPDDADIVGLVENMVEWRVLPSGPEEYYRGLSQAVAADQILGPESLPTTQTDDTLRDISRRILRQLDARRPWPANRFVRQPTNDWDVLTAPTIATIGVGVRDVEPRVWKIFDHLDLAGVRTPAMVIKLRSGEVIGLVGSTGPKPADRSTVSLRILQGDPVAAIANFKELTGFTSDQVVPTSPGETQG